MAKLNSNSGYDPVIETATCGHCANVTYCLMKDNNAGEYDPIPMCLGCIVTAIESYAASAIVTNGFQTGKLNEKQLLRKRSCNV